MLLIGVNAYYYYYFTILLNRTNEYYYYTYTFNFVDFNRILMQSIIIEWATDLQLEITHNAIDWHENTKT